MPVKPKTATILERARRLVADCARLSRLCRRNDTKCKVRLLSRPARPAATPAEKCAVEILRAEGEMSLSDLVENLAHASHREEIRSGGWALDLGLLGVGFFAAQMAREIRAANGALWQITPCRSETLELLSDLS